MSQSCSANHGCGVASPNSYRQSEPRLQHQHAPSFYTKWSNTTGGFTADAARPASATTGRPAVHGGVLKESDLLSHQSPLNEQSKMIYQGLDQEGKALALKLINGSCKGQNECKGLNS